MFCHLPRFIGTCLDIRESLGHDKQTLGYGINGSHVTYS